jgi:hypothetical protein
MPPTIGAVEELEAATLLLGAAGSVLLVAHADRPAAARHASAAVRRAGWLIGPP